MVLSLSRFGKAFSDPTLSRVLLHLVDGSQYPSELADSSIVHAISDLVDIVLTVDPACCEMKNLMLLSWLVS